MKQINKHTIAMHAATEVGGDFHIQNYFYQALQRSANRAMSASILFESTISIFVYIYNGNNLMTCASKLKVDHGIPGEPVLYLSGKYHML